MQYCGAVSDWRAVAHFELSFVHNKLGNTSAAIDAFKIGVGSDTGADNKFAPAQPAKQICSVLHNGTVHCVSASAPTPHPITQARCSGHSLHCCRHCAACARRRWIGSPAELRWMRCRASSCTSEPGAAPMHTRTVQVLHTGNWTPAPHPTTAVRHVLANYLLGAPWSLVRTGFEACGRGDARRRSADRRATGSRFRRRPPTIRTSRRKQQRNGSATAFDDVGRGALQRRLALVWSGGARYVR